MEQQHIALAYSIDNIQLAENIDQVLSSVGYSPQHYYGSKSSPDKALFEQLENHSGPILILITDNFLRSAQCMVGGREFIQDNREALLPIVADGIRQDESRNTYSVPTQFERMVDTIQYNSYWQDQYLDLRRQKRELKDEIDEVTFNDHLRKVRAISGETFEFLRLLRNTDHVTYEELETLHYEPVFRFIGDMKSWEDLKKRRMSKVIENSHATIGVGATSDPDLEVPPVEAEDIPGIDLLLNKETAAEVEPEPEAPSQTEVDTPSTLPLNLTQTFAKEEEEEKNDKIEAAEKAAEKAAVPKPTIDPEEVLSKINDWVSGGNSESAIQQLKAALAEHPSHTGLRYQLAHLLVKYQDDFEEARQQLGELLKHDSQHTDALFLSGELSEIEEDFDEAVGFYQDIVAVDPNYPEVHYRLGLIFAHQFEDTQDRALAAFTTAVAQNPGNADAHYQYGTLLNEYKNDYSAAAEQCKEALRLQPNHPFASYDLALIYHSLGHLEQAKEAYLHAVQLNPEVETPENNLAFGISQEEEGKEEIVEPSFEEPTPAEEIAEEKTTPEEVETPVLESLPENNVKREDGMAENTIERNALEALKENIFRLEEMIKARDEEQDKLKQQRPGHGKTVMVTGATSGIGRATAALFAQNGFRVILTGRRNDRLKELKKNFKEEYQTDIHTLHFDVRNVEAVDKAVAKLPKTWRKIDILINNAGKAKGFDPIHKGRLEHWEEMIDTNLKGLLYLTRAIAPGMVERKQGHIINICSTAGKEVYPNGNVYCATKHAVDALTLGMRLDLHKHNIRVSQVAPAHVEETEFAEVRFDGDKERGAKVYEDFQPLKSPDVAEAIYFIATRPAHVNVQDIVMLGTQQASSTVIDRSGR